MVARLVHFIFRDGEGNYHFQFPGGARVQAAAQDVKRSRPLCQLIDSAAASGETYITFPTNSELLHLYLWAAALQLDASTFQADAEGFRKCFEVRSWYVAV